MMQKIIIACKDTFGLEVLSLIHEVNNWYTRRNRDALYEVIGFLSEEESPFGSLQSPLPILGRFSDYEPSNDTKVVIGILEPHEKADAVSILRSRSASFETIVGPWMLSLRDWLTIGEGSIVCPYSAKPGMVIGDFVTIVATMISGHRIGDYSTLMRFSNIAGETVGRFSYLGDHVFLPLGKNVGNHCRVGSGSIVSKSVKDGTSVFGAPARKQKR